jgi:hypothetical protein
MTKESDNNLQNMRLRQLIAEVEGPPKSTRKADFTEREASNLLAAFLRWSIFGVLCLVAGYWAGNYNAKLLLSLRQPSEIQILNTQGWKQDGTGVFYRWCKEKCHTPRLYGGGVVQLFEVKCVDRPCGDIFMRFNVLNSKGEVVDQVLFKEKGLQGETRRFLVESQNSDATSLELSEFSARARV